MTTRIPVDRYRALRVAGALVGGKTAARVTDKDDDRLVGFLHRDRMP